MFWYFSTLSPASTIMQPSPSISTPYFLAPSLTPKHAPCFYSCLTPYPCVFQFPQFVVPYFHKWVIPRPCIFRCSTGDAYNFNCCNPCPGVSQPSASIAPYFNLSPFKSSLLICLLVVSQICCPFVPPVHHFLVLCVQTLPGYCIQFSLMGLLLLLYGLVCLMGCPCFCQCMFVTTLFYARITSPSQMDNLLQIHFSPELSPPSTPDIADFFAIPPISNNPSTQQQICQIHQNSILHTQLLNCIIKLLLGTHFQRQHQHQNLRLHPTWKKELLLK